MSMKQLVRTECGNREDREANVDGPFSSARAISKSDSRNGQHPVALIDLTLPQLAEAAHGLERLEKEYENMSGICATLKGLVFVEVKAKLKHGEYRPWLKKNFPRSSSTAERYVRLAQAFTKSVSTDAFAILKQSLADSLEDLRAIQLDLSHPVVAGVAAWVKGRGSYQLMLDFPGSRGGDTSAYRKKLSPAEEQKIFLESAKEDFESAFMSLDQLHEKQLWKAPSITDSHLEQAVELAREFARQAAAWLKTPRRERAKVDILL